MKHEFFVQQIERLKSQTGWQNAYGNERMDSIWKWSSNIREDVFEKVIETAINECEKAPLPSKLKEVYNSTKSQYRVQGRRECDRCDDHGSFYAYLKSDPMNGTDFACTYCKNTHRGLMPWKKEYFETHIPRFTKNIEIIHNGINLNVRELIEAAFAKQENK